MFILRRKWPLLPLLALLIGFTASCQKDEEVEEFNPVGHWKIENFRMRRGGGFNRTMVDQLVGMREFALLTDITLLEDQTVSWGVTDLLQEMGIPSSILYWTWRQEGAMIYMTANRTYEDMHKLVHSFAPERIAEFEVYEPIFSTIYELQFEVVDLHMEYVFDLLVAGEMLQAYAEPQISTLNGQIVALEEQIAVAQSPEQKAPLEAQLLELRAQLFEWEAIKEKGRQTIYYHQDLGLERGEPSFYIMRKVE